MVMMEKKDYDDDWRRMMDAADGPSSLEEIVCWAERLHELNP